MAFPVERGRLPPELAGELADIALSLLQLASISGIDLEQAILDKLRLNYGRRWDDRWRTPPPPLARSSGLS